MKRRQFLSVLTRKEASRRYYPENPPSDKGLDPYTGPWTFEEASHLLRRTIFGPTLTQMEQVAAMDLDSAINLLLQDIPLPDPPVNANYPDDQYVPIGQPWVGQPLNDANTTEHRSNRIRSLRAWNRAQLATDDINIREKMTLFWHNHYATEFNSSPEASYRHLTLLRENALGNFRELTKKITVDARMLKYLNGNKNTKAQPNENYARELLELFTVGKGPQTGPGDYTNYTEQDVVEGAKILTGWKIRGLNSTDPNQGLEVFFKPQAHTPGPKTLSHRFNNAVIQENGADEYKDYIDVIFQNPAAASFIVTKLYRFFVYYDITDTVRQNVIEPLAQLLIDSDYEMKPVVETLLKSEHFFDIPSRGCLLKTPIDYIESLIQQPVYQMPTELKDVYRVNLKIALASNSLGMLYLNPPSVSGWKAYYQSPTFHRNWVNSTFLQRRNNRKNNATGNGIGIANHSYAIDLIATVQLTSAPHDPNTVVADLVRLFLPVPVPDSLKDYLKSVLIPGLPDFEWTVEYNNYINNPDDDNIRLSLEKKIRKLLRAIFELPEFHLS